MECTPSRGSTPAHFTSELTLADFDYALPRGTDRAASAARAQRQPPAARDRPTGLDDLRFADIERLFAPGEVLVFNDTRVIKARLFGRKPSGGRVEVLVERIARADAARWRWCAPATARARRRAFVFGDAGRARATVRRPTRRLLRAASSTPTCSRLLERARPRAAAALHRARRRAGGQPSATRPCTRARPGAVAAPTAGPALHARPARRAARARRAVRATSRCTSAPAPSSRCACERVGRARDAREWYDDRRRGRRDDQPQRSAQGRRIVAVGTTSLRALESAAHRRPIGDGAWAQAAPRRACSSCRATASASSTG